MADDLLCPSDREEAAGAQPGRAQIIESALPVLALMADLAEHFQPLTLKQIGELVARNGRPTSQATLHRQLQTLVTAGWVTTGLTGKYRPSTRFAAFAVAYQQRIIARAEELLLDVQAVRTATEERISRATAL